MLEFDLLQITFYRPFSQQISSFSYFPLTFQRSAGTIRRVRAERSCWLVSVSKSRLSTWQVYYLKFPKKKFFVVFHNLWAGNRYLIVLHLNLCEKQLIEYKYECFFPFKKEKKNYKTAEYQTYQSNNFLVQCISSAKFEKEENQQEKSL